MRRLSVVLLALTLTRCDALRDAFSARVDVVASANGQTLTVDRLAALAALGKQVPLELPALNRLAHVWVDYTLFALEEAKGNDLRDSTTVGAAMWPLIAQMKWEHFHDRLLAARTGLHPQQVDSAYGAGQARLLQHILLRIPPSAAPTVDQHKRRQAEQVLVEARTASGTQFAQLAARYSEDPASKVQNGYLRVSERGQFVPAFGDAAWQLPPGGVSGVVKSPFGYHIIRRPPLAEVRDSFKAGLEARIAFHFDSLYLDSLASTRRIRVGGRASAAVRQALQDLDAARSSGTALVNYRGGAFRVRDLARWMFALDPQVAQAIPAATDDQISQFLRAVTQRHLLLVQADSAGVQLMPTDWEYLRVQHDSAVRMLQTVLNLSPAMLRDSAATPEARERFAVGRVHEYLDRVVPGRARFFPIPPFLGEALRTRATWKVDPAGVRRALELAKATRASADSLAPPSGPGLERAPGPAPVPAPDTSGARK